MTDFNVQGFVGDDGLPRRRHRRAARPTRGRLTVRKPRRLPLEELAPYVLPDATGAGAGRDVGRRRIGAVRPTAGRVRSTGDSCSATTTRSRSRSASARGCSCSPPAPPRPDTNFLGIEIVRKYQLFAADAGRGPQAAEREDRAAPTRRPSCATTSRPGASRRSTSTSPTRGGRRGTTSGCCSPRSSRPTSRGAAPGGRLHVATDVEDYFAMVTEMLAGDAGVPRGCRRRSRRAAARHGLPDELRAEVPQGGPADPPRALRDGKRP